MKFSVNAFLNDARCDTSSLTTAQQWVTSAKNNFEGVNDISAYLPSDWGNSVQVYRGHINSEWGLTSTLSRTIRDAGVDIEEFDLANAEEAMIAAATSGAASAPESANWSSSRLDLNMSPGQLLAILQHQGSPTRFLDVSLNALIALYFACETSDLTPGRIFIIRLAVDDPEPRKTALHAAPWLSLGDKDQKTLPWPRIRTKKNSDSNWTNRVCLVHPGNIDPRIAAQEGLFLVGGLTKGNFYQYWQRRTDVPDPATRKTASTNLTASEIRQVSEFGVHFPTKNPKKRPGIGSAKIKAYGRTLVIKPELKPYIRRILAAEPYGIGPGSIYPDFAGFRRLAYDTVAQTAKVSPNLRK